MEDFPKVTVPTIPSPDEDGSVTLSKKKLAELLVVIDRTLQYITAQLEICGNAANVRPGT
jgi:hypothetical protein